MSEQHRATRRRAYSERRHEGATFPTAPDRFALTVTAEAMHMAIEVVKARARAEGWVIRTVCAVRPAGEQTWTVELAVRPPVPA